jgi:hypothetical protein
MPAPTVIERPTGVVVPELRHLATTFLAPPEIRESDAGDGSYTFIGHAAVWNRLSVDLGGFRERILRGAFTASSTTRTSTSSWSPTTASARSPPSRAPAARRSSSPRTPRACASTPASPRPPSARPEDPHAARRRAGHELRVPRRRRRRHVGRGERRGHPHDPLDGRAHRRLDRQLPRVPAHRRQRPLDPRRAPRPARPLRQHDRPARLPTRSRASAPASRHARSSSLPSSRTRSTAPPPCSTPTASNGGRERALHQNRSRPPARDHPRRARADGNDERARIIARAAELNLRGIVPGTWAEDGTVRAGAALAAEQRETYNDIYTALNSALDDLLVDNGDFYYVWVQDFTATDVIFCAGGDLWSAPYTLVPGGTVTIGEPVNVRPVTEYVPMETAGLPAETVESEPARARRRGRAHRRARRARAATAVDEAPGPALTLHFAAVRA